MTADGEIIFVSLLVDPGRAASLAHLIDSLRASTPGRARPCLVPSVRGSAYLASTEIPEDVAGGSRMVFLVMNEAGLQVAASRVSGVFVVGDVPGSTFPIDPRWHLVRTDDDEAPLALAERAMRIFTPTVVAAADNPFTPGAAALVASVLANRLAAGRVAPRPGGPARQPQQHRVMPTARPRLPPLLETAEVLTLADPFDLMLEASERRAAVETPDATPLTRLTPPPPRPVLPWLVGRRSATVSVDRQLANRLVQRAPTVVVVGSRKGGVGKTSHAAGVAIVAGTALDTVGHRAAIVDANIANPDAWGYFDLPAEATTVRSLAAALAAGRTAPRPVNARSPALACFPETRDGAEYSRTDIRRIATHLRERFSFVVVDMSNRLPDPSAGPEAAAAAYWLAEADALVLPTACSRQDFNAVLDFLDVGGLPPVVVPCIVPSTRRNRRHPVTRQYLADISARVDAVVEMPDDTDRVRRAGMDGVAVQDVSAPLRSAYRRLTEAIADLPRHRR